MSPRKPPLAKAMAMPTPIVPGTRMPTRATSICTSLSGIFAGPRLGKEKMAAGRANGRRKRGSGKSWRSAASASSKGKVIALRHGPRRRPAVRRAHAPLPGELRRRGVESSTEPFSYTVIAITHPRRELPVPRGHFVSETNRPGQPTSLSKTASTRPRPRFAGEIGVRRQSCQAPGGAEPGAASAPRAAAARQQTRVHLRQASLAS